MSLLLRNKPALLSSCAFCLWKTGQGLSPLLLYYGYSPGEFIFTCKLLYWSSNRVECGHCACCCNDVRIGAKTYIIGHVIGADAFHLDAPTMGIYRSLAFKSGRSSLQYPWKKCEVGENAILGLSRAEMVRNTCFHIKYSLSQLWLEWLLLLFKLFINNYIRAFGLSQCVAISVTEVSDVDVDCIEAVHMLILYQQRSPIDYLLVLVIIDHIDIGWT